jgi:hypothetical protein
MPFLLTLMKRALEKGGPAAAIFNDLAERCKPDKGKSDLTTQFLIERVCRTGRISDAAETLRLFMKINRFSEQTKVLFGPWIAQEALARIESPLSPDNQREVYANTSQPNNIDWPDWWEEF